MIRKVLIGFICCCFCTTLVVAQEKKDTAFQSLYKRYYQLFGTNQKEKFYKASAEIQKYYKKRGDLTAYYKIRQNEIFYDTQYGESYKAIKKVHDMMEDMKEDGINHYELVYNTLGAIFETRGNYRMAEHYYEIAVRNVLPEDTATLVHAYAQLASLKVTREPDKAWEWNERMGALLKKSDPFYKVYLVLKGEIYFFKNKKTNFQQIKRVYDDCIKNTPDYNNYGYQIMDIMQKAFEGKTHEALQLLEGDIPDLPAINRCEFRIHIYDMNGEKNLALKEVNRRRDLRDSLNSDMIFNNINEINAQVGISKLNEKAAKEREMWLFIVILLLLLALGLIVSRYLVRRRYQKRIIKQNELLEIALSEAKESDRMKSSFIEHVSHEIRTPLNIITGYAQIISNPDFKLNEEQRGMMLQAISQNTVAITDIVNDLLEIAQDESKERYRREDTITINTLCRDLMSDAEKKNDKHLRLSFQTKLPDDYTIKSNESGIDKILRHLLSNALKFTEQGQVELFVHESPDHGCVRFVVTDTGVGIAPEHQEKVFERFYKIDSFKQGFGLGLPMSLKIATLLGGALAIDKGYTTGARFILTLPTA
ncbi:MAG: HAMP domain-containing histidine kinase [Prevotella sp.]|nr:HAMP domain-containing histidine kinase [Prevotella sp.]